jgi:hypothetical protein
MLIKYPRSKKFIPDWLVEVFGAAVMFAFFYFLLVVGLSL